MGKTAVMAGWMLALVTLLQVAGCASRSGGEPGVVPPVIRNQQPTTWQGDISCPGCTDHSMTLTVFPDGNFRLRDRYVAARGQSEELFHEIGQWAQVTEDDARLVLRGATSVPRQFRLLPDGNLLMLASDGRKIRSIREYVLKRQSKADPVAGPMRLLGLFQTDNGRSVFAECLTGMQLAVAEPGAALLRRQHEELLRSRKVRAGTPVLASLSGRLAEQPESASGLQLVVESLERFWPDEPCSRGPIAPALPLLETTWLLSELPGQPVRESILGRAAHIKLRPDGRLTGTTGCNRFTAQFQRNGARLSVSKLMVSRALCPASVATQERALLTALRTVREVRVSGSTLELADGEVTLASFTASEMQ